MAFSKAVEVKYQIILLLNCVLVYVLWNAIIQVQNLISFFSTSVFQAGVKLKAMNHSPWKLAFHRNFRLQFLLLLASLATQSSLNKLHFFLAMGVTVQVVVKLWFISLRNFIVSLPFYEVLEGHFSHKPALLSQATESLGTKAPEIL